MAWMFVGIARREGGIECGLRHVPIRLLYPRIADAPKMLDEGLMNVVAAVYSLSLRQLNTLILLQTQTCPCTHEPRSASHICVARSPMASCITLPLHTHALCGCW